MTKWHSVLFDDKTTGLIGPILPNIKGAEFAIKQLLGKHCRASYFHEIAGGFVVGITHCRAAVKVKTVTFLEN